MQWEVCRGEFQKNEVKEIASLDMGARNQYSSINFLGRFVEVISDWQAFKALRNRTTHVMNMMRREFYSDFVNKMSGDPQKLFAVMKKMLNQVKESPFPEHCNRLTLANELGAFFQNENI